MQRIKVPIHESLWPVVLYFEDLEALRSLFCEVSTNLTIQTRTHRLETLEELVQGPDVEINELEMGISDPQVHLGLSSKQLWLYASDDTPVQRGLFEKIKAFLKTRERKLARFHSPSLLGFLIGLAISAPFIIFTFVRAILWASLLDTLAVLLLIWTLCSTRIVFKRFCVIRPRRRSDSPTFLKRNQDRILLAILSALVGAAATVGLERLIK